MSDLSPFYLEKARANIREWKQARQPTVRLGGVDEAGVEYLQAAAEKLDVPDNSVDIVSAWVHEYVHIFMLEYSMHIDKDACHACMVVMVICPASRATMMCPCSTCVQHA